MKNPKYPSLYQINTRVWLTELSLDLGRHATLDDIPDHELDRFAEMGFDWLWFLSVWCTGSLGRQVSRENRGWRREFQETLPDLREEDIAGSGFAVTGYAVHPDLGGDSALARLRDRLRERGMKLMLDFVPNHMGPDHPWLEEHPDFFVAGTPADLEKSPQNYTRIKGNQGKRILAYGRDPYFDGWPDTLQLDYSNPSTQDAMVQELVKICGQCDGVRCDMAMLVLPEVFEKTWGRKSQSFWPRAIQTVHSKVPDFFFMAEVYWDMEWSLQQLGFDYTYDKRLYDRLVEGHARPVREHLMADLGYQEKMARFLENHDEPRAASVFELKKHEAAAVITFLSTGLRFFHHGQFEGRKKKLSPHLIRAPFEAIDEEVQKFYTRLLTVIRNPLFRDGEWRQVECVQAWNGNGTWDDFLAFAWQSAEGIQALVVVNYASHASQCFVRLPFYNMKGQTVRFMDTMSHAHYDRDGDELSAKGIYIDLPMWGYYIFDVEVPAKRL